jgi:hypothetical protein
MLDRMPNARRRSTVLVASFYAVVFAAIAVFGISARAASTRAATSAGALGSAVAQAPDPPGPSLNDLVLALSAHHWTIVFGVALFFVVGFAKQGWLSAWLASKIPDGYKALFALVLSLLTLAGSQIAAGAAVVPALLQALEAAAMAVFTHQVVINGFRKGREIVPETKKVSDARSIPPPPLAG